MTEDTSRVRLAEIAARLTEAQRNALHYPGGYADPNTIRALRRKGLIAGGLLTPLGLEVRAALRAKAAGEDA